MTFKLIDSEEFKEFSFNDENKKKAEKILTHYPTERKRSAVVPLLDIAQRQVGGWLPKSAIEYIAEYLELAPIRVWEVASFYTMFSLKPVGKYLLQVCTTTPCWLRGSDEIVKTCKKELGIEVGETTKDGKFSLIEVECLGACVNAPILQVNDDFYEDLDAKLCADLLGQLSNGEVPKCGSMIGRQTSAPQGINNVLEEAE